MSTTTSSNFFPATEILNQALNAINENKNNIVLEFWKILHSFLFQHWSPILIILLVILILSFIVALTGRWGWFGSVLYNYLYFGVLFVLGLIFGPKIFTNALIDIFLALLYVACYKTVGLVLDALGLRK